MRPDRTETGRPAGDSRGTGTAVSAAAPLLTLRVVRPDTFMTYRDTSRSPAIAIAAIAALVTGSSHPALDAQGAPADGRGGAAGDRRRVAARLRLARRRADPDLSATGGSWDLRRQMVAYAAVAYQPGNAAKPTLGTIAVEAATVGRRSRSGSSSSLR